MPEAGRVCTGYSCPYVAQYSNTAGTTTYSNGRRLGRGVSVSLSVTASDDNKFYADNQTAESAAGIFTGGTAELVVDGLLDESRQLIYGIGAADTDGWFHEGDSVSVPYVGVGFVVRYMSGGTTTFVPVILLKTKFATDGLEAATQEDEIAWQTQTLSTTLMRDDTANHDWRLIGEAQTTEALAEQMIKDFFNIQ